MTLRKSERSWVIGVIRCRNKGPVWVAWMADVLKVIGLMSGTSLDGVDAAILDTDGEGVAVPGPALTRPYDAWTRAMLRAALEAALHTPPDGPVSADIAKAERLLTDAHGAAVLALLEKAALKPGDIALLGFHGQTVLHRPSDRRTWQIGDGEALARATGIAVVNEFRAADVGAKDELIAFDTGPGNAALDDWALLHTGKPLDSDGKLAARGRVDETVLASMLHHPMFLQPPPKSLDRFDFPMTAVEGLSGPDGAATLTAFTAAAIARANEHLPRPPKCWIICGGGRHNPVLMRELRARLTGEVISAEDAGWRGDFLEAEAFGYLAVRSVRGLPLSLPSTTGVPYPMPGGRLHSPHTPSSVRA